jgi:hypothetical protein
MKQPPNEMTSVVLALGLSCLLTSSGWAQTGAAKPDLVSADWSVKSPHSLASNPPSADVVWAFVNYLHDVGHLCDFRFADLRHSGNLSLVVVIDTGATGGCAGTQIFDKTASGFEHYYIPAESGDSLRDNIQDINHDGKYELILWGELAPTETQSLSCKAEWPMIFAWTGTAYADVSSQYRGYYEGYLKSLDKHPAASSSIEEPPAPGIGQSSTPQPAALPAPESGTVESDASNGHGFERFVPAPSQAAAPDSTPGSEDYECKRIEVAKTQAFLGIHSGATMSDAIKDSESEDADKRMVAAAIFSYIGTQEARQDLKELTVDSDQEVAKVAKARLSGEQDPGDYQFDEEPISSRLLQKR